MDNLNITLTNGVYGLLGANGAGKTTLMRLLCNIQNPTSGKILLNGKNIVGLGERYRNLLGYLPQHFGYYPDFSAFDFLLYVSALKGLDEKAARKKSKELLEAVDLSRESKHKIKTFSGGMKQRLGIAQAMLNDPHILILDEPTAGLDVYKRQPMSATSRNICWRRCITPRSRWTAITHPLSAMTCTAAEIGGERLAGRNHAENPCALCGDR